MVPLTKAYLVGSTVDRSQVCNIVLLVRELWSLATTLPAAVEIMYLIDAVVTDIILWRLKARFDPPEYPSVQRHRKFRMHHFAGLRACFDIFQLAFPDDMINDQLSQLRVFGSLRENQSVDI